MEKVSCLLSYFDKQIEHVNRLHKVVIDVDLSIYEKQFLFAVKILQYYIAIEDLLKQIAKAFENHIDSKRDFHKELLVRMATEIPEIRPAVFSHSTYSFLDKFREFCDRVAHAYDCELNEEELEILQEKIKKEFAQLDGDLEKFRSYVHALANNSENQF